MRNNTRIWVWPDGTWCWEEEGGEMTHMSDDFEIHYADNDDQAERIAERVGRCQGGRCGV